MTENAREEVPIADSEYPASDATAKVTPQAAPVLSASVSQLSFRTATDQLSALTRFGSEATAVVSIEDKRRPTAQFERVFLRDGAFEIDSHGDLRDYLKYARAVEAIQAKAVALGYGAQSQAVPITSVPGGYVGRFGGNDIYAAAK
jgi:hypothetical protein